MALAILLALAGARARAAHLAVRNYTTRDGLPQAQVTALAQDADGYLWAGTNAGGLARYDGHRWRVYDAASGLPASSIDCLTADPDGGIIAGTNGGAARFHRGRWTSPPASPEPAENIVTAVWAAGGNRVWLGTRKGLVRWNTATNTIERVASPDGFTKTAVSAIEPDGAGGLFVGMTGGLARLPASGADRLEPVPGLPKGTVSALLVRPGRPLLAAVIDAGLYEGAPGDFRRVGGDESPGRRVLCLTGVKESPGAVWIGTDDRGAFLDRDSALEPFGRAQGLLNSSVSDILEDREGIVWLGTDGGLTKRGPSAFLTFDAQDGFPENQGVFGMAESTDGHLWFSAMETGLIRISPGGPTRIFTERDGLPDRRVNDVAADRLRGGVWVATRVGLARIDGDRVRKLSLPEEVPKNIQLLAPLGDGRLLLGTLSAGIFIFDGETAKKLPGPIGPGLSTIFVARDGVIWTGGDGWGAVGISPGLPPRVLTRTDGLPSNLVTNVFEDSRGSLWVSTDRGVWRRDSNGAARVYDRTHGLPDSFVYWTGEDREGSIWMGTNHGAVQLTPGGERRVYTSRDGLASDECNEQGFFVDSQGRVYIATLGVSVFLGRPRPVRAVEPPVKIEHILLAGREEPGFGDRPLPHDAGPITFRFAALSFADEGSVRFRYRLSGLSDAWSEAAPGQFETTYGSLAPGSYVFVVSAATGDGRASESPASVAFAVAPAWWRTRAASAAAAAALVALVLGIVHLRERRLLAARRDLEQKVGIRTEELRKANERLAELVWTDDLTGLANRRHILEKLVEAIAFARRQGTPFSLALADLDLFKNINDTLGHEEGDRFLCQAAHAMQGVLREEDLLGRYGGEEFLALFPGSDAAGAEAVGERMRCAVEELTITQAERIFPAGRPSVSIGIAALEETVRDGSELIRRADAALYRAKAAGRNRVESYASGDSRQIPAM
jgi:diguanylate cyclase (GGDEF)-like protein